MAGLSFLALSSYPGHGILFFLFCMVFLLLWTLAWFGYRSYFYIFFSTLCLLGFWMKACAQLITGRRFVEPVGAFDGSGAAWDKAIAVALIAGLGILTFRAFQMYFMRRHKGICAVTPQLSFVPYWYPALRKWIWAGTLFSILIVTFLNFHLGINQAGLLPKTHLPFKLNAIIIWCLYSAFAFWMAALTWWDICLGKAFRFEAIIFEGILTSTTILSRGLYITHIAPYMASIFINRKSIRPTLREYLSMGILFVVGLAIVIFSVAELRRSHFIVENNGPEMSRPFQAMDWASPQFLFLLSQRWIGLEGVMSTSSYQDVGIDLFKQGWLDMPSYSRKPVYERVSNSIYSSPNYPNGDKYNFISIPGLVAMLHFSGSLTVVFFGVVAMLLVISVGEYLIFYLLANPFILSLYGMIMAFMLHQFGGVYVNLIQIFEIGSFLMLIWGLKNIPKNYISK